MRDMELGLDLDCHLGLGLLGSLNLSWGFGLLLPLLGRGTFRVEVNTVEDLDRQWLLSTAALLTTPSHGYP